ncbi:hypothetical protein B0T25DRAFT_549646 [Lasiosphaeria hispida]|uniref:Uncharacterized protein n=1 Tax=Lasiosphaeria hispida TaxID=260671 RepID=A0AAJ0HG94_9PEZI|nr:hypothetical protein B0T25DRAFT_549646 [Lasiosphaeria hispida]
MSGCQVTYAFPSPRYTPPMCNPHQIEPQTEAPVITTSASVDLAELVRASNRQPSHLPTISETSREEKQKKNQRKGPPRPQRHFVDFPSRISKCPRTHLKTSSPIAEAQHPAVHPATQHPQKCHLPDRRKMPRSTQARAGSEVPRSDPDLLQLLSCAHRPLTVRLNLMTRVSSAVDLPSLASRTWISRKPNITASAYARRDARPNPRSTLPNAQMCLHSPLPARYRKSRIL